MSQAIREYDAQRHEPEGNANHNDEPEADRGDDPKGRREIIEQTQSNPSSQAKESWQGPNHMKGKGRGSLPIPARDTTNIQQQINLDEAIAMTLFMRDDPSLELTKEPSLGSDGSIPHDRQKSNSCD